jgi:hypothetical protein
MKRSSRSRARGVMNAKLLPPGWGPMLDRWTRLVSNREWGREADCAWWYGERASVSQLAGAAWKTARDGWAMTEYAWTRGELVDDASRARVDLCVQANNGALRSVAEAKQAWPRLGQDDVAMIAETRLALAAAELGSASASKLQRHDSYDHVAVVFLAPMIAVQHMDDARVLVGGLLDTVEQMPNCSAAWAFPAWAVACQWGPPDHVYPGVVAVVREVRRRTVGLRKRARPRRG